MEFGLSVQAHVPRHEADPEGAEHTRLMPSSAASDWRDAIGATK